MITGFVTFEGIDGSGKTTVSRIVTEKLRSLGHPVFLTSEPTSAWLGDVVRRGVERDSGALSEAFLFLADRAGHIPEIRRHLARRELVLCDRYADSTYAYQGARLSKLLKDPIRFLQRASDEWILQPDLTIFLRVPPLVALRRIKNRSNKVRFEDLRLLREVARNYDRLAKSRRFAVVDATRPMDQVGAETLSAIQGRLPLRGRG